MVGALGYVGGRSLKEARLQHSNELLSNQLTGIQGRVAGLETDLGSLADRDAELRVLAGLDVIDREVLEVGIGGPGSPTLEENPLYEVDPLAASQTFAVSYDLNALERRSRLLRESIMEAGDSLAAHRDLLEATPSILPAAGYLSSGFSSARLHPIHNEELPHEGVDIAAPRGTPILAAAKGRVTEAGRESGYGLTVEIDHGYGYSTLYGHASQVLVRPGQQVERGDVIGLVGSTGLSTGPHLHYEVRVAGRAVDPMNYVLTGGVP